MTIRTEELAKLGVHLEQVDNGIMVCQNDECYLAREWRLNDELVVLISKFIGAGFRCLIRRGHPQPVNRLAGVAYIGFSTSETEPWFAVVDQYSGQAPVKRITVNSRFRDLLTAAGVPFNWETAGGQNMFVSVDDIDQLLTVVTPSIALNLANPGGNQGPRGAPAALTSEAGLQSLLIEKAHSQRFSDVFGAVKFVIANPRWRNNADNLDPQSWDIPDVIVETDNTLWVLELKLHEVGVQAVHQVARYVANPTCRAIAGGREIRPVAIGYYKSPELAPALTHSARGVEVSLWTYCWSAERGLELFSG